MDLRLIPILLFSIVAPTTPLVPVWSPDHQFLATTKVQQRLVTPEGGNYKLLINGKLVYPTKTRHGLFSAYKDQHTFLSELAWSPDNQDLAFIEKIYDWEYLDPYNSDFAGWASNMRYYLTIVSPDGVAKGYRLDHVPADFDVQWVGPDRVELNDRIFDLRANPPQPIR